MVGWLDGSMLFFSFLDFKFFCLDFFFVVWLGVGFLSKSGYVVTVVFGDSAWRQHS